MAERDRYIAGVPCWVDTTQPNPATASVFYRDLFGWEMVDTMPPDAPGHYFVAHIRGKDVAAVSSLPEGAPPVAVWNSYVWVDDVDESAAKVADAGGRLLTEPFDVMDLGRTAMFADPEGAVLCLWQAGRHRGAQVVNEHGSVNFNNLNTRDIVGAAAFYRAVFGWTVLHLPGGGLAWALPGYGDHLELLTPGTLQRMAEMGAPTGFENVVAAIGARVDDQPDKSAHWSVTFAVDDADAVATRAAELGGQVVSPPTDAPWVRSTTIADPQGATFLANQFVPETGTSS